MRKSLLALVILAVLAVPVLAGCWFAGGTLGDSPASPPASEEPSGGDSGASSQNPFVGRWVSAEGYVEYRSDGTWIDGAGLPDGTFTEDGTGTYEVTVGDGYYELKEMWPGTDVEPMVFYVVFSEGTANFYASTSAMSQGEIQTIYTETAPGQWERQVLPRPIKTKPEEDQY